MKYGFLLITLVLCSTVFCTGNIWSDQDGQATEEKANMRAAFIRCDFGNEHFGEGRVVVDLFGTHAVVSVAQEGQLQVTSFSIDEKIFEQVASEASTVITEFADRPLAGLEPGETVVSITLGFHGQNETRSVEVSLSDLSAKGVGKALADRILNFEQNARLAFAEKDSPIEAPELAADGDDSVQFKLVVFAGAATETIAAGEITRSEYERWFTKDYAVGGERVETPKSASSIGALIVVDGNQTLVMPLCTWQIESVHTYFACQSEAIGRAPMFSICTESETKAEFLSRVESQIMDLPARDE